MIKSIRNLLLCGVAFRVFAIQASEKENITPSAITQVTVFLNQAQVTRVAKVSLDGGKNNLVFDNLSPLIKPNSVQVRTTNGIELVSVTQRQNYLKLSEKTTEQLRLEDSITSTEEMLTALKIKKDALNIEKDLLNANKQLGGSNTGLKTEELEDALALYRKRTEEIGEEWVRIMRNEKPLTEILTKLKQQLAQLIANRQNPNELVITVQCDKPVSNGAVEFSYVVDGAQWIPSYDIRVKNINQPIQLTSKGAISQQTGEDWSQVDLTLSTLSPSTGGTKPTLVAQQLRFEQELMKAAMGMRYKTNARDISGAPATAEYMASDGNASVIESAIQVEYKVSTPYSIPSDNNYHSVDLVVNELPARYGYATVPKYNKAAFATALVPTNAVTNLLPGEASVYFNGTFTGSTYIQNTSNDSQTVTLGVDNRIQVERTLLKEVCSNSTFGSTRKDVKVYEIAIRNVHKEAISIFVEDQIPVSTEKEIEVTLLESTNAKFEPLTGGLSWQLDVAPESTVKVRFSFEVKSPKNRVITPY